jgi:FkbM family methyltransferase
MGSWLNEDQNDKLFLDIGAATGAACIPLSKICGNKVKIIAFEPAENNRRLLQETIIRNNISNIDIFDEAVSNYDGNVEFTSYGPDPLGLIPYLPETSSISYHGINKVNATISQVACITLDSFFYSILKSKKIKTVVKIDVEGFEIEVLQGGVRFIEEIKPSFSIDIHYLPKFVTQKSKAEGLEGSGTTEDECRKILGRFGYNFDKIGHVLLATPI